MTTQVAAASAVLDLHVDLYPRDAVDRTVAAFSALAELQVETAGAYHRITIRPRAAADADHLGREIANYALTLAANLPGDEGPAPDPAPLAPRPE